MNQINLSPYNGEIKCMDCGVLLEKVYFKKKVVAVASAWVRYSFGNKSEFLGFVCYNCYFKNEPCLDEDCPSGDRRDCPQKLSGQCDICTDEFVDWLERGE